MKRSLEAFIDFVETRRVDAISDADADTLVEAARVILDVLGA